jgi:hypothetical protein
MNRADDKSTELELDPDLVGHDPELADAVESIRNAVRPSGIKTRAERSAVTDERARADTIRVVTVRRDNDAPESPEVNAKRPARRHVLNVPSGFLTRALPLYWPAPADAAESRRRRGIIAVVLVVGCSLGLCVFAYIRNSVSGEAEPVLVRQPPVHVNTKAPAPTTDTRLHPAEHPAEPALPSGGESAPAATESVPAATENTAQTEPAPSEPIRHAPAASKSRDKAVSAPAPVAEPRTAARPVSSSSEHKSWFEVR